MRDPYEVLGVDRKASANDIKSAFRRLAKKLHPDANKNDPKAASRFAELNAAYEILGEDDKRKAFDRGEIDAEGKPRFPVRRFWRRRWALRPPRRRLWSRCGIRKLSALVRKALPATPGAAAPARAGGGGGFEDILREAFGGMGGAGARRGGAGAAFEPEDFGAGANFTAALTVSLQDAAHGATQRLRFPPARMSKSKFPPAFTTASKSDCAGKAWRGRAERAIF